MTNLLYVTCNVSPQEGSRTLSLGQEFLEEYLRWHVHDEVQVVDLYRDNIQRADQDVMGVWGRIARGGDYLLLSDEERWKMSRIWRRADQFGRCQKYVFVTHSLNLWFPPEFKMYVDAICVPEYSYRFAADGVAQVMLPDMRRKSLHLHAGPRFPLGAEQDLSVPYLRSLLDFFGVADQTTVVLQGDDPEVGSKKEYEAARSRLLKLARRF